MGRPVTRASLAGCLALGLACADGGALDGTGGSGGATSNTSAASVASAAQGTGGHGCFATETLCAGACVDVTDTPAHCGMCDNPCAAGPEEAGECIDGQCSFACAAGFVADEDGVCTNFRGAHEIYPVECPGCSTQNPLTQSCGCPPGTNPLALAVQSDCPGIPMRMKTTLDLCVGGAVAADSDFGGAYQVDDFDGWCGATAQCRVGNPLAGGACACPDGFTDAISLRSIARLPCDGSEVGTVVTFCGRQSAPLRSFGGAYQYDDFAPECRVPNPYTGACSCPADTTDVSYRVMVDGAPGLYGSTMHLCLD
jgi:hypothetical protein